MINVWPTWLSTADWSSWLLVLAFFLCVVALLTLVFGGKQRSSPTRHEITLRDLSALWTKDGGRKTVHISELSPLWHDKQEVPAAAEEPIKFRNNRAATFWKQLHGWAWFEKFPLQRSICGQLLELLDTKGNCPSVVNLRTDTEGLWDESTYKILSKITLLDHSLNVAEEVVQLLSEYKAGHVIPDAVLAALAHDLGKLESVHKYLYTVGDHPLAAGLPLAGISEFKTLPKKDEILHAIKLHHRKSETLLGKTLKKADQLARQKELELATEAEYAKKPSIPPANEDEGPVSTSVKSSPPPPQAERDDQAAAAWRVQADIYGETGVVKQESEPADQPKTIDISSWFDAPRFLDAMKPYINRVYEKGTFMAFSMPNGIVYFQSKVLEEVARKMAEQAGCMEIISIAPRDPSMRNVLFSIVQCLRVEHDVIARGLIQNNFFGGYFRVTRKIGLPMKGYYTPFHAEAFGSIAEMERAKSDVLRDIMKVTAVLGEE